MRQFLACLLSCLLSVTAFGQTTKIDWITQIKSKPFVDAREYNFKPLSPGGSVSVGSNTKTVTPCPLGVAGTYTSNYLYLSGGTGTAESVLITGGTCTSGASTGTLIFTAANTHSGAWTISSASSGVQEAMMVAAASGGGVIKTSTVSPATIRAAVTVPVTARIALMGDGPGLLSVVRASNYTNGHLFTCQSGCIFAVFNIGIDNTATTPSSGSALNWKQSSPVVDSISIADGYRGILLEAASIGRINGYTYYSANASTRAGLEMTDVAGVPTTDIRVQGGLIYNVTGTNCIRLTGADSILISGFTLGFSQSPLSIVPNTGTYVANIDFGNNEIDSPITNGVTILTLNSGAVVGNVSIHDNKILAETVNPDTVYGVDIATSAAPQASITDVQIVDNQFINWGSHCIAASGTGAYNNYLISGNTFRNCNSKNNAGQGSILLFAANGVSLASNMSAGGAHDFYDVLISSSAAHLSITGGDFSNAATGPINLNGITPTNFVWANIGGISNVVGTVADAATIALPLNEYFTLTGSGTAVTAFSGPITSVHTWQMVPTGGNIAFTAGATIGNSCTTTQNKPYTLTSDGTKIWINGPGC